jgi:hypothetical protein
MKVVHSLWWGEADGSQFRNRRISRRHEPCQ